MVTKRLTYLLLGFALGALAACAQEDAPEDESTTEQAILPPPAVVTATATSPSRITVSWTAVPGAIKYYVYERVTMLGPEYYAGTTVAPGTSLARANLQPGTEYCYRVRTVDAQGPGPFSAPLACATTPAPAMPPPPPANVSATPTSSSRITVSWTTVVTATGYHIYQSDTGPAGPFNYINSVAAPGTSIQIANLLANTQYCYKVASYNGNGVGSQSNPAACATTFVDGLEGYWKFNEGSGVVANDLSGQDRDGTIVNATWSQDRPPMDNNPYTLSFTGDPTSAVSVPDASAWWFTGNFTVSLWAKVPSAPTATVRIAGKRQPNCGPTNWELGQDAMGLYFVGTGTPARFAGMSLTPGRWTHIAVTQSGGTAVLYLDGVQVATGGFTTGARSTDPLQFGNSGGCTSAAVLVDWIRIYTSQLSTAEIEVLGLRPAAPANFTATVLGAKTVGLSWDPVPNAFKYFVYKGTMSGNQTWFATVPAGTTTYTDAANSPSTQVSYYVTSVQNGLISDPSNEQVVTTDPPIAAPSGVMATAISSSRIRIDWNAVGGAVKYYVYESLSAVGPFSFRGTVLGANPPTYTAANLMSNTTYYYYVVTEGVDSTSSPSATVSATTFP